MEVVGSIPIAPTKTRRKAAQVKLGGFFVFRAAMPKISKEAAQQNFIEQPIGPVIGSHVGPGMVSLCFWGRDKREEMSVADRIARKVRGK